MPVSKYVHTYTYIEKETYIHLCRKYAFPFHIEKETYIERKRPISISAASTRSHFMPVSKSCDFFFLASTFFIFLFFYFSGFDLASWLYIVSILGHWPFSCFSIYFFWQRTGIMTLYSQYTEFFYYFLMFFLILFWQRPGLWNPICLPAPRQLMSLLATAIIWLPMGSDVCVCVCVCVCRRSPHPCAPSMHVNVYVVWERECVCVCACV